MITNVATNVASFIDERPVSAFQWSVFLTAMLISMLDGFDLQAMALAVPAIADQWAVDPQAFGPVFTATPIGMIFGALILGPIADRWGRKTPTIISVTLFGLFTLLTPLAPSVAVMAVFRFMLGVGAGGILPNLIALVSEYAPRRTRASLTTLTFSAIPFGSMVSGLIGGWLIPTHGWQSIFYVGGIVPLLIAAWCTFYLPESLRFLASRGDRNAQILQVLRRVAPRESLDQGTRFSIDQRATAKVSLMRLFGPGRTAPTLLITSVVALNTFMLYFMLSWLPTVLEQAGLSERQAVLATVLPNLGGVIGAITLGRFIDRFNGFHVMAVGGLIAGSAALAVGFGYEQTFVLIPALFFAGTCVMGGQPALYALLASMYPTPIRGSGAGFGLGAGRMGSIVGPLAGALVLSLDWSVAAIFVMAAAPGFTFALCLAVIDRIPRRFS